MNRFTARPTPACKKFRPTDHIALQDAAAIIASRTQQDGETQREARDRASHRLNYAIKTGELRITKGHWLASGCIAAWARHIWPQKFSDWSATIREKIVDVTASAECDVTGTPLPPTNERSHELLRTVHAEYDHKVTELQAEVDTNRSDAKKWRNQQERNRRHRQAVDR